jgi:uncharacterized membrane protein
MKKWKCLVCGYVHEGDEPPAKCPVCGAPKSSFIDISEPEPEKPEPVTAVETETVDQPAVSEPSTSAETPIFQEPVSPFADSKYLKLYDMMTQYHAHPILVHIPNGMLPVAVFFIFFAAIFGLEGMARVAVYNMGAVAFSMPLVVYTGWVVWQHKFNGAFTEVFIVKIACAIVISVTSWFIFIWLLFSPQVITSPEASSRVAFFMINLIMLATAAVAGWYGGKLVFRD